ncbi:iron-sulfur cluster biosynthesis family protein [Georgenia deserti]|uniref:Iron-sulfur cluster biosynthesis family protein n=1 Tax=Georgenia deserti TaxID=2093781 RepID=A0ABW4L0X1_9MICO
MLTLTDNAQAAVKGLTSEANLPESGGVRIALTEDQSQLEMSLVTEPEASDEVIETEDARVFVSAETSPILSSHTLDAGQTQDGIGFSLKPQDQPEEAQEA